MFLLKIINKSFFSSNWITQNHISYIFHNLKVLKFLKKEVLTFYLSWLFMFVLNKWYSIKVRTSYFVSRFYFFILTKQKPIRYVININSSLSNTFISMNSINGSPKLFYSAGMFNLQKKQKTKQPKAIIIILRALLLKFKILKTKPAALHLNNLFFNHQSYIFKKLKQKIFIKFITSYNHNPHNGCRLKKKKRIKLRTQTKKLEGMTEWLKVADCKSVKNFLTVGSNPTSFIEI